MYQAVSLEYVMSSDLDLIFMVLCRDC